MEIEIGIIYEFLPKAKVKRKKGVPKHLEHYHYFVATKLTESGLEGHMLTSTPRVYEYNENFREGDFEQSFADGEECVVQYKNSQFLTIPLIKLNADEVIRASYIISRVGKLTDNGLKLIHCKKKQDQAMTWLDYLIKYCSYSY